MISLEKGEGYPQDFRNPRIDEIAEHYAARHFGQAKIEAITETLHRSRISKQALEEDLMKYDRVYVPRVKDPVYELALESVRREMTPETPLIPLTLGGVEHHPDLTKNRSPGLPWKLQGYRTKAEVLAKPENVATWHRKWDNIGRARKNVHLPDTALFLRAQVARQGKEKIRAVWGFPLDVIVEEGRTFFPYLQWLKKERTPVAYGIEIATGGMRYVDDMLRDFPNSQYIIGDWSEFDKTVPAWLIKDAFSIVMNSFDFTKVEDSTGLIWPVNETQSIRRAKRVIRYFVNTPIRLNDGRRFMKTGGVPSGSMFTNIIDSLINMIVMRYTLYHTTGRMPQAELYLGDDSVLVADGIINLDDMADVAEQAFGMKLNRQKSYVTTKTHNVHFIGYYNRDGKPYKPQDFAIASFIFPERNVDEEDDVLRVARAVGQMWSTMDGAQAVTWWHIIRDLMARSNIRESEVYEYILSSGNQFKYLKILGVPLEDMSIPQNTNEFIWAIEPPAVARKTYRRRIINYVDVWNDIVDDVDEDISALYH